MIQLETHKISLLWQHLESPSYLQKTKIQGTQKNYRLITCLPTVHKILTVALTNRIYNHLLSNSILPEEQKGCHIMSRGCEDQLLVFFFILFFYLVSKMMTSLAKKHHRHLCMACIG